jgi:hypothetical protein
VKQLALCLLAVAAGCSKTNPTSPSASVSTAPAASSDETQAALTSAGLKVEAFKPTDPGRFSAYRCSTGKVERLDVLQCDYGDPNAARMAKRSGEAWIGAALTGVAIERGRTLLVVADRERVDPNGKIIARITKALRGQ